MTAAPVPDYESAYAKRIQEAYGFLPAPNALLCPVALSNKRRCTRDAKCICRFRDGIDGAPDFLDHSRRWIDRNGYAVLTAEPYFPVFLRPGRGIIFSSLIEELRSIDIAMYYGDVSPWLATHGYAGESTDSRAVRPVHNRSSTQLLIMRPNTPIPARKSAVRATPPKFGPYPLPDNVVRLRLTSSFINPDGSLKESFPSME